MKLYKEFTSTGDNFGFSTNEFMTATKHMNKWLQHNEPYLKSYHVVSYVNNGDNILLAYKAKAHMKLC